MKKILFFTACLAVQFSDAQNIQDVVRVSSDEPIGTARYLAMSGAFTALGGDLSSVGINPASSAVFLSGSGNVSLGILDKANDSQYENRTARGIDTDVALNQAGGVFVFNNFNENSKWKKFTLGLNYDNTNNYDNFLTANGTSNTSISNFFLSEAQGIPLDLLQLQGGETIADLYSFLGETEGVTAQNAFLGYQGFLIDPLEDTPSNLVYTNAVNGNNFNQEYAKETSGYSGKYTLNVAAQYTDNFFFGVNLNTHTIEYRERKTFREQNNTPNTSADFVLFEENLLSLGNGFSAQIGAIAKIKNNIRLGLSYETPTWYEISEETTQYLRTVSESQNRDIRLDPGVINIFQTHQVKTPSKLQMGAAYIFGQKGLISLDYSIKDYSGSTLEIANNSAPFQELNSEISNTLTSAASIKVGGEYRYKDMSFRAGARLEESPYQDKAILDDLSGYSLGFGYNFGNYTFDLAYSFAEQDGSQILYNGLANGITTQNKQNNIIITLGFNL
ncbi:putative hemin receptor [unidentified eubacterium SCB49]|nr:putative hemin receptor [unidentified eubacterium SCB49]